MKTREEVQELKRCWLTSPYWDLSATPGFKEYVDELAKFQSAREAEWNDVVETEERVEFFRRIYKQSLGETQ